MSTFSHSLSPVHAKRLALVSAPQSVEEQEALPADDGLGCMRGLAVAMFLNVFFVLMIFGGWELWHHLR